MLTTKCETLVEMRTKFEGYYLNKNMTRKGLGYVDPKIASAWVDYQRGWINCDDALREAGLIGR